MFTELDSESRQEMTWYTPEEFPAATRGAKLTIWELPTRNMVDQFRVKGIRMSLSLDPGRYIIVHSCAANWWQRYTSVDCTKEEYDEIREMSKRSQIPGMKSVVTTEGGRLDCTSSGCKFSTISSIEAIRHFRQHQGYIPKPDASKITVNTIARDTDGDEIPKAPLPKETPKRQSLKDQILEASKERG